MKLSQDRQRMPISALQSLPELAGNPFVLRIVNLFDRDRDGMVSLEEFTQALLFFRNLNTPEDKLKRNSPLTQCTSATSPRPPTTVLPALSHPFPPAVVFSLYDLDRDGYVGESELIATMKQLQQNLSEQQLEQVLLPLSLPGVAPLFPAAPDILHLINAA